VGLEPEVGGREEGVEREVAEWVGEWDFYFVRVGGYGVGGVMGEVGLEDGDESVDVTPAGKGGVGTAGGVVSCSKG